VISGKQFVFIWQAKRRECASSWKFVWKKFCNANIYKEMTKWTSSYKMVISFEFLYAWDHLSWWDLNYIGKQHQSNHSNVSHPCYAKCHNAVQYHRPQRRSEMQRIWASKLYQEYSEVTDLMTIQTEIGFLPCSMLCDTISYWQQFLGFFKM